MLRPATLADIPAILDLERLPSSREFVGQWNEDRHRATLVSLDARYFVADAIEPHPTANQLAAYAILRGFAESSNSIELKRIAVHTPGRGLGRQFLHALIRTVFEDFKAHRLFLDVFETNARARHVYESLGFVYEGVLREAALVDGQYHSLRLMSLLDREYAARRSS
jgi:L-amino acid N-acyltransferase YncA